MKKLMGLFLAAALITGLLAGCAGTPAGNNGTSTPESTPATTETSAAEPSESDESAWPRTYVDATGAEVVIEKQPERVAVVHALEIESVYALGVIPIAAGDADAIINGYATLEGLRGKGVIDLGGSASPNLEKLLEAEPDLIIATYYTQGEMWDELKKIAPVVALKIPDPYAYTDALREYAEVLGRENEVEQVIDDRYAKLEDARQKLASIDETVVQVFLSNGKVGSIQGSTIWTLYDAEEGLGLKAPEGLPETWQEISLEGLAELNPDHILIGVSSDSEGQAISDEYASSTVWNSLTAVKNNQVYIIDSSILNGQAYGMPILIDYILERLVK